MMHYGWPFRIIMSLILVPMILGLLLFGIAGMAYGQWAQGVFLVLLAAIAGVLLWDAWQWHGPA